MLVNLQTIIGMAEAGGFCVPAFNVYNTETLMGVIAAAEEAHAPVIVQVYPRLIKEEVGFYICPAAVAAAGRASVPVCLHLDHGSDLFSVQRSLRWGMTGIMLDGSTHPLEENIALTRQVVELCAAVGVGVEGEIGHVGSVNDAAMDEFTSCAVFGTVGCRPLPPLCGKTRRLCRRGLSDMGRRRGNPDAGRRVFRKQHHIGTDRLYHGQKPIKQSERASGGCPLCLMIQKNLMISSKIGLFGGTAAEKCPPPS